MLWIAIRMLTGDAQKFYGLVFGIAFSTLLITPDDLPMLAVGEGQGEDRIVR